MNWGIHFDLASKKLRVEELEKTMEDQHFWDDAKESAKVIKEVKGLKDTIETFSKLEGLYEDVETLIEMGYEEEDEAIVAEVKESFEQLEKQLEEERKLYEKLKEKFG